MAQTKIKLIQIEKIVSGELLNSFIDDGLISKELLKLDVQTLLSYIDTNGSIVNKISSLIKANPDWTELNVTASCKVIADKIATYIKNTPNWTETDLAPTCKAVSDYVIAKIGNITGAMLWKGAWVNAPTTGIKAGYTYAVTTAAKIEAIDLEIGDVLIANKDNANKAVAADWTIIQANLTGVVTSSQTLADEQLILGAGGKTIKGDTRTIPFPKIDQGKIVAGSIDDLPIKPNKLTFVITTAGAVLNVGVNNSDFMNRQYGVIVARNGIIQTMGADADYTWNDITITFSIPLRVDENVSLFGIVSK